jgi:hypothetical protein
MQERDVAYVERALGVTLPAEYRAALLAAGSAEADLPEFYTDPQQIVQVNEHFTLDPNDLSAYEKLWLVRLRLKLFPRSRRQLSARLAAHKQEWAGAHRLSIGSDLGEEQYFIVLTEQPPAVYRFRLEGGRIDKVASSVAEWVVEAHRLQAEASREP